MYFDRQKLRKAKVGVHDAARRGVLVIQLLALVAGIADVLNGVIDTRHYRLRLWLAALLIRVAAWVLGAGFSVKHKEARDVS